MRPLAMFFWVMVVVGVAAWYFWPPSVTKIDAGSIVYMPPAPVVVNTSMDGTIHGQLPPNYEQKPSSIQDNFSTTNTTRTNITNNTILVNSTRKDVHFVPPRQCLHGILVTDSMGKTWCTRSLGGEEQRSYDEWLANQTLYNRTNNITENITRYVYYRENCTIIPDNYTWNAIDFIVNSSHPLTCEQIQSWQHNDAIY